MSLAQAVDKEADHIQITALTRALTIHTRIAYLDQSDGETALHEFEEGSEDVLGCALLYRQSFLSPVSRITSLIGNDRTGSL